MKKILLSLLLVIAIAASSVGGYYAYKKFFRKVVYDYEKGTIASKKVDNAQYTPDMDKYLEAQNSIVSPMAVSTEEEFAELIDKYATIENYAGAGKYLGYDIYEIKEEIQFIVDKVPAFNQWFRMPSMRENEGYISIPYYEWWAYYLEMNEDILSITRVCWSTRSSYLDPTDNSTIIEDHDDGSSFIQYEIMKTNYYINADNDEVVECYIYSVGIDNVKNGVNTNTKDYYPFEYQYLKNIKDKSLIKYHITVSDREYKAMDIRGLNPYGVRREFLIVNYDGYTNIDVTEIDQRFANLANPSNNGSVSYDMNSDNIKLLVKNVGVSEEEYNSSTSEKDLLDKIAKQIIDNFEIKNNWPTIYKESSDAIEIELIKGPFYGQKLPISDVYVYVGCRGHYKEEIEFDAGADIYDQSLININKEYSLSMALKERTTGKLYIIATHYNKPQQTYYNGSETEYYYRFEGTSLDLNASVIKVDTDGTYDIVCVLTERENDEDKILLDTLEIGYLRQYYGLIIPNSVDENGIIHHYTCKSTGGKLTIVVTSEKIDEIA